MIRALLALAALPIAASAQVPPAPVVSGGSSPRLLAWMPGEVRCGGTVVTPTVLRRPLNDLFWPNDAGLKAMTYRFDIDGTGRAVSIRRTGGSEYAPSSDDVAPSLVATRFAPGVTRTGCTLAYVPRVTAVGDAPVADLVSYTVTPRSGALPEEGWARIKGSGNCADVPRPEPLVQVLPDYRALPATPGVKDWTLVGYDLDTHGRPRAVRPVYTTGNAALNAAAVRAMGRSRFTLGAHRGCLNPYALAPATLAAPPIPEVTAFRPAGATCPQQHDWATPPALRFPEPYLRRAIEGWAIVTYDVAPWGEVGNVRVVAAQPSEDFGTQALNLLRSAKMPTTQGLVGCIDRVMFMMPPSASGRRG